MTYHGGKIMTTVVSKTIFWGTSWAAYTGDKITGIDTWYTGHGGRNYAEDGRRVHRHATARVAQHAPTRATSSTPRRRAAATTSTILAEVCKQITAGNIVPDPWQRLLPGLHRREARQRRLLRVAQRGHVRRRRPVQFAFFFNLDGDAGCDPRRHPGGHSQGLAALANVTAHELSEARTDPASPGAWYDASGERERRQVRVDVQRAVRHLPERHPVEAPGRVVERGVHGRDRLPEFVRVRRDVSWNGR